jgi:hypothetical protein
MCRELHEPFMPDIAESFNKINYRSNAFLSTGLSTTNGRESGARVTTSLFLCLVLREKWLLYVGLWKTNLFESWHMNQCPRLSLMFDLSI